MAPTHWCVKPVEGLMARIGPVMTTFELGTTGHELGSWDVILWVAGERAADRARL